MIINIKCNLSSEQTAKLQLYLASTLAAREETLEQLFQRFFWDGYEADGVIMDGAVWAQVRQWMKEQLESEVASTMLLAKLED